MHLEGHAVHACSISEPFISKPFSIFDAGIRPHLCVNVKSKYALEVVSVAKSSFQIAVIGLVWQYRG